MIQVIHQINNKELVGDGDYKFLLTNKKGNYLLLGEEESDFDGYFTYDVERQSLFKILHNFSLDTSPEKILNGLTWVERISGSTKERFTITSNALIIDIENYEGDATITLDAKRLYDESTQGRTYSYKQENKPVQTANIHYTKFTDGSLQKKDYERFISISAQGATIQPYTTSSDDTCFGVWKKVFLKKDKQRNMQAERWVLDAVKLRVHKNARIIITSSSKFDKLQEKKDYLQTHHETIIQANNSYPIQRFAKKELLQSIAEHALDSLITKIKDRPERGIFAGLPWFFQYWMRDEAISCGALIQQEHYALVKEILLRWVHAIKKDQITAHKTSTLLSADGPGFIAKRINDLLKKLNSDVNNYFSQEEIKLIKESFDEYMKTLQYDDRGFVINQEKETWMDTAPEGMNRSGARIEIQCLQLCILELQETTSQLLGMSSKDYSRKKKHLQERVKEVFFREQNNMLIDGLSLDGVADTTPRPNIFLAYYIHPQLLTKKDWERSIDATIDYLWLSWGGLSSISKQHELFQQTHTGIDNKSYHQGDSWYFINNIVAQTLFSLNPHKYYDMIHKIFEASKKDLLFLGAVGHSSEISSAIQQQSTGCISQAWSVATFLELIKLMRRE